MKKVYNLIIGTTVAVSILSTANFIFLYRSVHVVVDGLGKPGNLTIRQVAEVLPLDINAQRWHWFEAVQIHLYPHSAQAPSGIALSGPSRNFGKRLDRLLNRD